jgi:hypothetical protein
MLLLCGNFINGRTEHCRAHQHLKLFNQLKYLPPSGGLNFTDPLDWLYNDITLINSEPWWKPHKLLSLAFHSPHRQTGFM